MRLVTTNFDRLFEKVICDDGLSISRFAAPTLPVPKNRWDGLVYLHGLLPEIKNDEMLQRLVVTSGDFGLAYLNERWAARFVSELFRSYTVCFVGYSINDPILRYMMDALAADSLMGESNPKAYAFGSYYPAAKFDEAEREWAAKNVKPILYKGRRCHEYLHETLAAWAANYRDGVLAKQSIVSSYCHLTPAITTRQDNFVGRLNWALSDKSGLPAKHFADASPAPSLDWLEPFTDQALGHNDLGRFGVMANFEVDQKLKFSLLRRPSPYTLSADMSPVTHSSASMGDFDQVMMHMARWLARHIHDPRLFLWVVSQGGILHPRLKWQIQNELEDRPPSKALQNLWDLLLAGRIKNTSSHAELYSWAKKFASSGLTSILRFELQAVLKPLVKVSRPYRFDSFEKEHEAFPEEKAEPAVRDVVEAEVVLNVDYAHSAIENIRQDDDWPSATARLLPDLVALLLDAMELMSVLQQANEHEDLSHIHQPSISPHDQNKDFNEWTVLIDLVRDAWLAKLEIDERAAAAELRKWVGTKFPIFKRLAFFGATHKPDLLQDAEGLEWLLGEQCYWLWTIYTRRETVRFVVSISLNASRETQARLQSKIVEGPPVSMFREGLEQSDLERTQKRMTWMLLAKIRASGATLFEDAQSKVEEIEAEHPNWQVAEDERDEFSMWTSDGEDLRSYDQAPTDLEELKQWLKKKPDPDDFRDSDDWTDVCTKREKLALDALKGLAEEGTYPIGRWRQALQAWSNKEEQITDIWKTAAPLLTDFGQHQIEELSHQIAWFLKVASKWVSFADPYFLVLINRIFEHHETQDIDLGEDVISRAINHPTGLAIEALLSCWFRSGLEDGQGISSNIRPMFDRVFSPEAHGLGFCRVILAGHLLTLFRVDRGWTEKNLLPDFAWQSSQERARGMWMSFLHSPRIYWPVLNALKDDFFEVPNHFEELGQSYRRQYISLLTFSALDTNAGFTEGEFKTVLHALPIGQLERVANTLFRAMQGAGENKTEYFENRICPFFVKLWPKNAGAKTQDVSKSFALLCSVSGSALPAALDLLSDWLQPVDDINLVAHLLEQSDSARDFPSETLALLSIIVNEQDQWLPEDLKKLLLAIREERPDLQYDADFVRLTTLLQQRGHEWP